MTLDWTMERAKAAGLTGKDNWRNYPRQMLKARCISEGVRAVFPGACSGIYSVEEVQDMGASAPPAEMEVVIAPVKEKPAKNQETIIGKTDDEYRIEAKAIASERVIPDERVRELWKSSAHEWQKFIAALNAEL